MSPSHRTAFAAALAVTASPCAVIAQAQTRSPIEHVIVIVGENLHHADRKYGTVGCSLCGRALAGVVIWAR